MNLIIISQDKKSMWDFSQCEIFISKNNIHEILIRPYCVPNGVSLATYEDPKRTEKVFNEIINVFSKSKLLLTSKTNLSLKDMETAKKYFENLNKEKFIVSNDMFNITPVGNSFNVTYQLPEDMGII